MRALTLILVPGIAIAEPPEVRVGPARDIVVDGALDEAAWAAAPAVDTFVRYQPTAGGPPPGTTEVRFLQDDRYLYAGVRVTGADYPIRARVSRREDINADDQIGIYLDTFRDRRSGYIFYLNALGVQQDFRRNGDAVSFQWDAVFRSEGRVTEDGYELEIAWPWRSLRYARDSDEWGVIVTRKIPHDNAKYGFPTLERGHPRWFAQAAPLRGIRPPPRGTGLEVLPQLTVVQRGLRDAPGAPLAWTDWDRPLAIVRPSLDARLGLSPNLGLAATVNPDFSQVESDVTPVSLNQRFAFFFQERRPFFLEGAEYFQDPTASLYTRSMVSPYGGVKVAGREGPWQLGVLTALDATPGASVHEEGAPGFAADDVDGAVAQTSFARVAHDVGESGSVGMTVADKRSFRGGPVGAHDLAAIDARLPIAGRWVVSGSHAHSLTGRAGEAPLHGMESWVRVQRRSGIGTGVLLDVVDRTPGLRKETGFLTQSGVTSVTAGVDHTFEPDGSISTIRPGVSAQWFAERDGDRFREVTTTHEIVVNGVHGAWAGARLGDRRQDGVEVGTWLAELGLWGQAGRTLEARVGVEASRQLAFARLVPARSVAGETEITLRPTAGIRIDTLGRLQRFAPDAARPALAGRLRNRVQWQFTKPLGLRLVSEWNQGTDRDPTLLTSVLFTWLRSPGTAVWIGASEVTDLTGKPQASSRAVFGKVSVLFRP